MLADYIFKSVAFNNVIIIYIKPIGIHCEDEDTYMYISYISLRLSF